MSHSAYIKYGLLAASVSLAMISSQGHAAGFGITEQSITGLGASFSTGSAGAGDGSTVYFNPAGMSFLESKREITLGAHVIDPNAHFKDNGSTNFIASALTMTAVPLDVNNESGGDAGPVALVPNFYYTRPINDKLMFGFGMGAPFGLVTDYDDGWVGRYHALTSDLKTVNLNPSLSYQVNKNFSLGVGVNAQYIKARLTNAVDWGSICLAEENINMNPMVPAGTCAALRLEAQANDGEAEVTGDDWSLGYNFGMMWQASPQTRIGLAYRSRVKHTLEGEADFDTPANAAPIAGGAGLVDRDVTAKVTLPDSLSVGFDHQANDKLTINGDITWTNWSLLDELRVTFDTDAALADADDNVTTLNWKDSNRYSLGLTYVQNKKWTWRAGIAYDEATQEGAENISVRVPDNDRFWLSAGFTYSPSKNMNVDFGYAHLFVDDQDISKLGSATDPTDENNTRGNLVGEYELDVNIISAQARWSF